jgi:hypothetical protein
MVRGLWTAGSSGDAMTAEEDGECEKNEEAEGG